MKTKDIAKRWGFDRKHFEQWIEQSSHRVRSGFTGMDIEDGQDIEQIVQLYQVDLAAEQAKAEAERLDQEERERVKQAALSSMLITSGFSFDGYTITRYSGYISGDDAISMDRPSQGWLGGVNRDVAGDLLDGLVHIRRRALIELKEAAYALGCNAVIGVDFDYLTMDPETVNNQGGTLYLPFLFAVTANGNAVVIEKNR